MDIIVYLMFNLCLLLVLLFLFIIFIEQKITDFSDNFYFFYFSISLIICLSLSFAITEYFFIDLRQIPLVLGGLYMGPLLGGFLFIIVVFMRGLIGVDLGFWISTICFLALTISTWTLHKKFLLLNKHRKVMLATALAFFTPIIWGTTYLTRGYGVNLIADIIVFLIPILGTTIIIYSIESVREKLVYRTRVLDSEKMEAVSHISASIAHEVRNPLTVTRGFLQLLQNPSVPVEKRSEYANIAINELDRAENIIADYLTFAKPTLNEKKDLVVSEELQKIVEVITPFANMNTVQIEVDFISKATIHGDKVKFHQSIINIFKNCIEAMPNGGKLTILTYNENDRLIIKIKDTGVGMTGAQIQRLGEPYFSNKGIKGTGLGMMVTYSIVRAMNGKIEVTSAVNNGTIFKLAFPLIKENSLKASDQQETLISLK